jgi:hypothetical protein
MSDIYDLTGLYKQWQPIWRWNTIRNLHMEKENGQGRGHSSVTRKYTENSKTEEGRK